MRAGERTTAAHQQREASAGHFDQITKLTTANPPLLSALQGSTEAAQLKAAVT